MFAEAESEELLNLLTQVRLVADQEEQQQQQQSGGALYKYTSPPPPPPSSLPSLPQSGALIGAAAPAAASPSAPAAGRYTASSTAAAPTVTDWAVLERSGADGAGHKGSGHHTSPTSTATASELSRTPATGAKVLQHPLERDIAGRDLFEADVNDAYQQPKQLFFMDAHKRSVQQQQQQQQRQLQGSGVGSHSTIRTPSTPGSMTDRAVHQQQQQQQQQQYVATALLSRESSVYALSPHNTSVMRGSDGTRSQAPSCSRTPQPQQQQQQNRQQHSMTMASISGDMNSVAGSRPTSRDSHAVAIPSSAAVLSTVLSGYAPQHQQQQQYQQQETDSLREEREDSSGHTHLDELARIAAEYDGSSDTEKEEYHDDHSANNSKYHTSISTDRAAYTAAAAAAAAAGHGGGLRGDGGDVWVTAKQLNTPHHPSSSSLGSHADPAVSGSGGWLRSRDAAASATSPFSPTAAQSQRRGSPLRAVVNAEAVVDDFFRLHSATAAEMADANAQPASGVSAAAASVERNTRGGTGRATHEQEAAWRLNVEAELHELQHNSSGGGAGGADGAPGGGPSSQCVPVYKTPTTFTNTAAAGAAGTVFNAVSPLSATATTPYHQLLSQMRHSPQSGAAMSATTGGVGRVTGGAVRANTPPDSRAFFATQFQQPPPMPQSYLSPQQQQQQQHPGIARPLSAASGSFVADGAMSGGMAAAGVPRYTANVTRVGPSASSLGGDGRTMAAARPLTQGNSPGQTWSQQQQQQQRHPIASLSPSSDTSATAAAVWERLSPYERAAAAAAAAAAASMSRPNSSALLHTPDTVAKPVTLSSIASHLHGDNYNGSDAADSVYSRPTMQQQQQQQQLRFPTPPTFTSTTAAAAVSNGAYQQSVNSSIVSPSSVSYPRAAGVGRPSEASAVSGSAFSGGPLFLPTSPQGPHSTAAAAAGGGVGGGGAVAGGPGRLPQAGTPSQLFGWPNPSPSSSPLSQAAPSRTMRSHPLQQQQTPASFRRQSPDGVAPYPFPQHLATAAAPAHSTATGVNSPPSCSLRPSPQMRATDGSSPTLRRYVITTPNARASSNNNTTTTTTFNSAGQHSTGVSPLGNSGQGNGASTTAAAAAAGGGGNQRESRPRVQLSHMSHLASPGFARSPLNASSGLPHSAYGPNNNNNSMSASSVGGHGNSLSGGGGSMTAAVAAAAAASSVSAAAVRALIERLQAVAPAVLGTDAAAAAAAAHRDTCQAGPELDNLSGSGVSALSNVPDVASASAILAMSHDQHGCRLLQAVLDTECESDDTAAAIAVEAVAGTDAGGERNAFSRQHEDRNNNNISAAAAAAGAGDLRRQRRAEAFYKSVAVQVVLRAIEPRLDAVMADGYGNFLLQKVFDMAPDAERQRLLRLPSLQNHLCEVACSPHGTFAVQRLVETVRNTEEERLVFVALEHDLLRLLTNANGGHVLMKVMECIRRQYTALANGATDATATTATSAATGTTPATAVSVMDAAGTADRAGSPATPPLRSLLQERVDALFTVMKENLLFVCQHKQGCCIVQKCLDFLHACSGLSQGSASAAESAHGDHAADYFERMSALLLPHAQELSVHPFGNYVITRLVAVCYARGNTATIDAVAAVMQRDLVRMCTNKFASNVVEHILRHCSERRIRAICQSLMHSSPANCGNSNNNNGGGAGLNAALMATVHPSIARLPLTNVVMDSYGNYVIQTLLTVAPVEELTSATAADGGMLPVLQQLLPLLGSRNFGRKLETKTELAVLRVEQYQQQQQRRRA